jgi:hypothetical protein
MDWVDWIKVNISIDTSSPFSFFVVKSWFLAIHGWLTGAYVKDGMAAAIPFSYCANGAGKLNKDDR